MMEAIKGIARRTTQSIRERVTGADTTPLDPQVIEVARKVRLMEAKSASICEKVIRAARLMEDLGVTLKELGEEYQLVPDLAISSRQLAADVQDVGAKLMETSQEHQKGLKDNGFDILHHFSRECTKLQDLEEAGRHHQLEYDFFKAKVLQLRQTPQKDFTRIPRNEQIMENWRVEQWRVSESYKALLSKLYVDGRRAVDLSVLTTLQVLNSFVDIASTGFKQTFYNARLPEYPAEPVLPPAPLPPNPLPPQSQLSIANAPYNNSIPPSPNGSTNAAGGTSSSYQNQPYNTGYAPQGWSQPSAAAAPQHQPQPPWASANTPSPAQQPQPQQSYDPHGSAQPATAPAYSTTYQPPVVHPAGPMAAPPSLNEPYQPPRV